MTAGGRRPLRRDEEGSFLVLEAILVALLVLTAILFFTNVQRPSAGAGEGGLDLGQVAADTLQILQQRTFTVNGQGQAFNAWVTNATAGDAATADEVHTFIRQILPTGAHYSLRLDNGVSTLQILPAGATEVPRNARAAEVATVPLWAAFRNNTVSGALRVVVPGQVVAPSDPLYPLVTTGTYGCYEAPYNSTKGPGAPGGVEWSTRWQSPVQATSPTTNGKDTSAVLGANQQVPRDLPLGKWRLADAAGQSGHCSNGTPTYVTVVPPGERVLTVSTVTASTVVTASSSTARFSLADKGLEVSGAGIIAGTRIQSVQSPTQVTLSQAAAATGSTTLVLPIDPTFLPYGIQLVVWFGA